MKSGTGRRGAPRVRGAGLYTEAQFWGFIRSGLREKHQRWKPRSEAIRLASRKLKADKRKVEVKCALCKKWWGRREIHADHVTPVGSLMSYQDLPGFVERLFCEVEGYRVLCKECHKSVTNEQRREKTNGLRKQAAKRQS